MGLIYLDGDDDEISRRVERMSRAVRSVKPRMWMQEEVRDFESAHICRKCEGLIPAGRLHRRIQAGGPERREHVGECEVPRAPRTAEDGRWASAAVLLVAVVGMLVLAACAFLRALR